MPTRYLAPTVVLLLGLALAASACGTCGPCESRCAVRQPCFSGPVWHGPRCADLCAAHSPRVFLGGYGVYGPAMVVTPGPCRAFAAPVLPGLCGIEGRSFCCGTRGLSLKAADALLDEAKLLAKTNLDLAIRRASQAKLVRPSWWKAWSVLAEMYELKGDTKLAGACVRKAIELGSPDPADASRLARCLGATALPK
jgi:hypothetical protein